MVTPHDLIHNLNSYEGVLFIIEEIIADYREDRSIETKQMFLDEVAYSFEARLSLPIVVNVTH